MPPLPKRKYAKARQGDRRAHLALTEPQVVECSQCHQPRLPHRACPHCGYYKDEQVIKVGKPKKSE